MKRLHKVNDEKKIIETYIDRESIEKEISSYNTKYFKQAYNIIIYKDKIYKCLKYDKIRDKVLNRSIRKEDCDNERMYQLLRLSKISRRRQYQRRINEITAERGRRW